MSTAAFPTRIRFSEAQDIIAAVTGRLAPVVESVPVARALGRVLAEDLVAGLPLPGFDNAAMDGFALRSADGAAPRRLIGERFAGEAGDDVVGAGECWRVTTGAMLPRGADAVLVKEQARVEGDIVSPAQAIVPGQHVRRLGEDVASGDHVLRAGIVLDPGHLALAAALGRHELRAHRRPTVAIFTTGDELRPPGQALAPGQIHDSNRVLLQTLLIAEGYEPVAWPILRDDPAAIASALADAAASFDLVLTCGGVSAGEKDFLPAWLRERGQVHFWKVMMRPGMPVLCGQVDGAQFLGLPGNPVSVLATFLTLGRQMLDGLQGRTSPRPSCRAGLLAPIRKSHERLEFLRGALRCDAEGRLQVSANPADGSHRLRAAAESNALIRLPEGAGEWPEGAVVEVVPYAAFGVGS